MPEAVEGRGAVQQDRVVLDDLFEDVPDLGPDALDDALGALDVVGEALLDQLAHDERLEQLEGHLLGQAALVELELRADHDDRAARVVDALAEQVLAEPALLALEHVGQALEPMVAGARDRPAAPAVVDQRVARLLQHPLLVADDDLRRLEVEEPAEAVVAVDDAPIQVVQVGRGEPAAVELDHRPQVGRNDRQGGQDHPLGSRAALAEGLDQAQPLDRLLAALAGGLVRISTWSSRASSSRSSCSMILRIASAPMPASNIRPLLAPERSCSSRGAVLGLAQGLHDLERLISSRACASSSWRPSASRATCSRSSASVSSMPTSGRRSSARRALLVGLALLELGVDRLGLGRRVLRRARRGVLGGVAGGDDDLAGRGEDDVSSATRLAPARQPRPPGPR